VWVGAVKERDRTNPGWSRTKLPLPTSESTHGLLTQSDHIPKNYKSVNALTSYSRESYAPVKHLPRRSPYLSKALTNFSLAMYESQLVDKPIPAMALTVSLLDGNGFAHPKLVGSSCGGSAAYMATSRAYRYSMNRRIILHIRCSILVVDI
jgi:hypothetical protein